MLKTKVKSKFIIALGIMLLAVLVFNMNTVNAETDINLSLQEQEVKTFNAKFEAYNQQLSGTNTKSLINEVKANNAVSNYQVKVNKELSEISNTEEYGVILQYDNDGRVNEVIIGQNIQYGGITIIDSNGAIKTTFEPQSGGGQGSINANADYSNYQFLLAVQNNYGQSFETELGTFTYTTKYQDLVGMMVGENGYIYICPVKMSNITSQKYKLNLVFSAINVDTNGEEQVNATIDVFRSGYKENANLKVGDTNLVEDGKVVKSSIVDGEAFAAYNEMTNTLQLMNYTGKIVYSNMGSTFKIEKDENSNIEVICEDDTNTNTSVITLTDNATKIEFVAPEGAVPNNTVLEVVAIGEGTTYNMVKQALADVKNFKVFDINLLSDGTKIQPNGKVKISIPIPTDMDKSNLAVYRIEDNGNKTEYKVTIEGNYATFETDHFSTYVLADNAKENSTTTPSTTDRKKDETPKTGTVNVVGYLSIITVVSALGIIAFRRKK